jgi:MtN3 and saliva related transmembrane protein
MMAMADIVGYAATVVGTFLMVPQVVRAIRTKHMGDVSGMMIGAYVLNCTLWGLYGALIGAVPVMLCNGIALVIGIIQAGLKRKYG